MNKQEALSLLNIKGSYTPELLKASYRKLVSEYHPDRNPLGLHMMQLINQAYELVGECTGETEEEQSFCEDILNALRSVSELGLNIELCGTWIWVSGNTKPHRELFKANKFKRAPKKGMWYFHSGERKSFSRGKYSIDDIRIMHGTREVKVQGFQKVGAA